jgi:uncharacterized membrane protein
MSLGSIPKPSERKKKKRGKKEKKEEQIKHFYLQITVITTYIYYVLSSLIYSYTLDSCLINITELNGTWSRKS